MITVLVVSSSAGFDELASRSSTVEVLRARSAEEALEKLGRNRRIDAILLADLNDPAGLVAEILDDHPSPPPIFLSAACSPAARTRRLPTDRPDELLALLERALSA